MNLLTAGRGYWFQATIKQPTDEDVVVRSGFHARMEDGRLHRMAYDSIQTAGTRHWIRFNSGEVWGKIPGRTDHMAITFHDADGQLMDKFEFEVEGVEALAGTKENKQAYDLWRQDQRLEIEENVYDPKLNGKFTVSAASMVRFNVGLDGKATVRFVADPRATSHRVIVISRKDFTDWCAVYLNRSDYFEDNEGQCEVNGRGKYHARVVSYLDLPYANARAIGKIKRTVAGE